MQTFLPLLLVYDESKSLLENLWDYFYLCASLMDKKRLGKQRVEASQLLDIVTGRKLTRWQNHPASKMWSSYPEALKLYFNAFLHRWLDLGCNNTMSFEEIDEVQLIEQGVAPFLLNQHYIQRMQANLLSKDPLFYGQYNWSVQPKKGYYWWYQGNWVLCKWSKRFPVDLSGEEAPADPEEPVKRRRKEANF